jgi:hypothetical protein
VTRLVLMAALLSLIATAALAVTLTRSDGALAQLPPVPIPTVTAVPTPTLPGTSSPPQQLVLKVGDTLRVDGVAMGCQVTRRAGRPTIECRRGGSLAGTYGTFFSDRGVTVARFHSSHTAQTILTARHGGPWRACGSKARTATLARASRGCR